MHGFATLRLVLVSAVAPCALGADAPGDAAQSPGKVTFRDSSEIVCDVVSMKEGLLKLKRPNGSDAEAKWAFVTGVVSSRKLVLVLRRGERLEGTVRPSTERGSLEVTDDSGASKTVPIRYVDEINPTETGIRGKLNLNLAASISDGNTQARALAALGEFEAEAYRHRFGVSGLYRYADDESGVTARNWRAAGHYDYFFLPRIYGTAGARFDSDEFQDLNLRTTLHAGPGYQVARPGDYPEEWLNGIRWLNTIDLRAEAGLAYIIEDYDQGSDTSYLSARWSAKLDWPITPRLTIYHHHEGFPSLERAKDLSISTVQGFRFKLLSGLQAGFQVNWDWDNTPSKGFDRSDFIYLVTLGYYLEF